MLTAAKIPLWLWPNILSLDAPIIAALWQNLFARDVNVHLSVASRAALPLSVWLIYLLDRLLDTSGGAPYPATARHRFYHQHRSFCYLLAALAAALLVVTAFYLPPQVFKNGLAISASVGIYLLIVHGLPQSRLPKEATVCLIFAVGTVLAPFTRAFYPRQMLAPALLFSILLWLNCSAIEAWESGAPLWAARNMKVLAIVVGLCCLPLSIWLPPGDHSASALFITAAGLWQIANQHERLALDAVRVWLEVPLLTPLLFLGVR